MNHLTDAECRAELERALDEVDALVRVTEPVNAFMDALGRSETWTRFLTLPHAVPTTGAM